MTKKHNLILKKVATIFVVLITILSMALVPPVQACSRLMYESPNGPVTARSMDWFADPDAQLWFFEKGMKRNGGAGANSIKWTSKYSSIVTTSYETATVDGINDQGLVANLLFLGATDYGSVSPCDNTISIGAWGQYVLDNYATVEEAVKELKEKPLKVVTINFNQLEALRPGSIPKDILGVDIEGHKVGELDFSLHMSVADASGDSAVFEYIGGELIVHHKSEDPSHSYDVMTNDPTFEEQLAINTYWNLANGFLPGTNSASDRFPRASYYLKTMEDNAAKYGLEEDRRKELAAALGIIRNVSDPLGLSGFSFSTTQWRTLANQIVTDSAIPTYFFEYTKSPNLFWAVMKELEEMSVDDDANAMALHNLTDLTLTGNVSQRFEKEAPFSWDISSVLD